MNTAGEEIRLNLLFPRFFSRIVSILFVFDEIVQLKVLILSGFC